MPRHGVYGYELPTSAPVPASQLSGLPFVIGVSAIQAAEDPAPIGAPVLIRSFSEFKKKLGYSSDTEKYGLCEFAEVFFALYAQRPIIAVNLLDPATNNTSVAAANIDVVGHRAEISVDAINDANLVVKSTGGTAVTLVKDTDYVVMYSEAACYVVLLPSSTHYSDASLNIAYKKVSPAAVNAAAVVTGLESVELCATTLGTVPDMIAAPGFSQNATVAAAMAQKASGINGMFRAVAVVDLDPTAATPSAAITAKGTAVMSDKNTIVCWPMVLVGDKKQYLSSHMCGRMAATDQARDNVPSRSPSNQPMPDVDALVLSDGTKVELTLADANDLNNAGICTAINFLGSYRAFGNYTADAEAEDPKDRYIAFVRMFAYVNNLIIRRLWDKLDEPLTWRLVDSLTDEINLMLNGLVGSGHLYGARVEFNAGENPLEDLEQGIAKIHVYICPEPPFQEAVYYIEYDASYVRVAFAALEEE